MLFAAFAQKKLLVNTMLNCAQAQQSHLSMSQMLLATDKAGLNQELSALGCCKAGKLASLYSELAVTNDTNVKSHLEARIKELENSSKYDEQTVNNRLYSLAVKENALEMQIKSLDTMVAVLQEWMQAIEQAESEGAKSITPKYAA